MLLWQQKTGKWFWRWRVKLGICQQLTRQQNPLPLPLYRLITLIWFYNKFKIETVENKTSGRVSHEAMNVMVWNEPEGRDSREISLLEDSVPLVTHTLLKSVFSLSSLFSKCDSSPWEHPLLREHKRFKIVYSNIMKDYLHLKVFCYGESV